MDQLVAARRRREQGLKPRSRQGPDEVSAESEGAGETDEGEEGAAGAEGEAAGQVGHAAGEGEFIPEADHAHVC